MTGSEKIHVFSVIRQGYFASRDNHAKIFLGQKKLRRMIVLWQSSLLGWIYKKKTTRNHVVFNRMTKNLAIENKELSIDVLLIFISLDTLYVNRLLLCGFVCCLLIEICFACLLELVRLTFLVNLKRKRIILRWNLVISIA